LQRAAQPRGFEPRFRQLALRIGVENDAAPRVIVDIGPGDHRRPDREPELTVSARVEHTERATVDAAWPGFELVDDLHRPPLRRARDRSLRKGGGEERREP